MIRTCNGPGSIGIRFKERVPYSDCSAQARLAPPFVSRPRRQVAGALDNLSDRDLQRADGAGTNRARRF